MSNPIEKVQGNVIPTDKEVAKQQQQQQQPDLLNNNNSSINPNPEENGRPIYSTENPLMQPPTQIQSLESPTTATTTTEENRSNTEENPQEVVTPTNTTNTTTTPTPTQQEQQVPRPKADTSSIDQTVQGLLIQVVALLHNKNQQQ